MRFNQMLRDLKIKFYENKACIFFPTFFSANLFDFNSGSI